MRSCEQPNSFGETLSLEPAAGAALAWRYLDLVQQHRDLDSLISALSESAVCDEALTARMKKRKLQLKDELARFEGVASAISTSVAAGIA